MSDDERNEWDDENDDEEYDYDADERSEDDTSDVERKEEDEESDEESEEEEYEDEEGLEVKEKKLKKKKHTSLLMSDFEYSEIIKKRVKQIEEGNPANPEVVNYLKSRGIDRTVDIAMEEFRRDLFDFEITRDINGVLEIWTRKDFKYFPRY